MLQCSPCAHPARYTSTFLFTFFSIHSFYFNSCTIQSDLKSQTSELVNLLQWVFRLTLYFLFSNFFSHNLLPPFLYFIVKFACYMFAFILNFLSNLLAIDSYENVFMCYIYLGIYLVKDKSHFLVISPVVNTVILL